MAKNKKGKRTKEGRVERLMSIVLDRPTYFPATTKKDTSTSCSSKLVNEDSCWEQLFAWGDEVQKEAKFTQQDHIDIVAEVRRMKRCE